MRNILILLFLPFTLSASAQEVRAFSQLAVGGSAGTTGLGVEAATPINRHLTLRGQLNVLSPGALKLKLTNSMGDIYYLMGVTDPNINEAAANKKVEVGAKLSSVTGKILMDCHPWENRSFHVTVGIIVGNRSVAHLYNTEKGNMKFFTLTNQYVREYNEYFHTAYPEVGLKFGDYLFTADADGNLDVRMLVNAVRPYWGIGWGHSIDVTHQRKLRTNFDFGFEYWGKPQFKLNGGEKLVKTSNNAESGVLKFLSGFQAWPTLRLTLCGDLF